MNSMQTHAPQYYCLADLSPKASVNKYDNSTDYLCEDMIGLSEILKGALIMTAEQVAECKEQRRLRREESKQRERAFALYHNWKEIMAGMHHEPIKRKPRTIIPDKPSAYREVNTLLDNGEEIDVPAMATKWGLEEKTIKTYISKWRFIQRAKEEAIW